MIGRLIKLGVLVALLVAADVAARGFVSSTVNTRAQQDAPPGSKVTASVGGFPFLPPLALSGTVKTASVHLENVNANVVVFSTVDVDLTGVHIDRARLIQDRKARITKIDKGTVTATITADALSKALSGVPVTMNGGTLTIAGVPFTPTVGADNTLSLRPGVALKIPSSGYVPCVSNVVVQDSRLELSCIINNVPPALIDTVQKAAGG